MKPILDIQNISKKYKLRGQGTPYLTLRDTLFGKNKIKKQEEFWALKDINFKVYQGESIGIIGHNGAGKSTLLKILSRITPPTKGKIISRGRIASLLEVGTGFHAELTGMENIFLNGSILGLKRAEIKKKLEGIIDFAGIEKFIETPLKHYSSGMQLRLAFAVAAHLEPEILIIDEVLAVGDAEFQKKSLGKMKDITNSGRTVLFVSHNMGAVQSICNTSVLIEKGQVKIHDKTHKVIASYLDTEFTSNIVYFKDEIIKQLEIKQIGNTIRLRAKYQHEEEIKQANLGFVIYDELGFPITGTNPLKSGIRNFKDASKKGLVEVLISSPILADGNYSVSIWLNDGIGKMLFHKPNCLKLEINQMGNYIEKNKNIEGSTVPICEWNFQNN